MTKLAANLPFPPHWINAYIFDKLSEYDDIGVDSSQPLSPILATTPTNIDELYNNLLQSSPVSGPLMIQYEKLLRFRTNPFYGIKKEQLVYYLYSNSIANINNAITVISQLLDREDVAAQELNAWAEANALSVGKPHNVFFHKIRVYHIDESRDITQLASARTLVGNKIIIEYDYHVSEPDTYEFL